MDTIFCVHMAALIIFHIFTSLRAHSQMDTFFCIHIAALIFFYIAAGKPPSESAVRGKLLWDTCLNAAVVLHTCHRQAGDRKYANLLRSLACGNPTSDGITLLNTRVLKGNATPEDTESGETTIIVPTNEARCEINRAAFSRACQGTPPHPGGWAARGILAVEGTFHEPTRAKQGTLGPPLRDRSKIAGLKAKIIPVVEKKINMSAELQIIIGGRYMIMKNINIRRGLVNGMLIQITAVHLRPGTVPRWFPLRGRGFFPTCR